jgi:hypothetical protein
VGIRFDAAQRSSFEDVTIDATGGFAGVTAVPGRGMATVNVEVRGGRYGFHLVSTGLGGSLVGVVLRDQTVSAIHARVWRGLAVTGFLIEKDKGPVIDHAAGNVQASNLVLTDGQIKLKAPSLAIKTDAAAFLHLRNVYVRGASAVVQGGGGAKAVPPAASKWTLVGAYTHCPTKPRNGVSSYNAIDGKRHQQELARIEAVTGEPPDLVAAHVPAAIASFEDAGIVSARTLGAKGDGKTDDTKALRQALAKHQRVFLPAGDYKISQPLELGASSQLIGVPGLRSRLVAADSWTAKTPTWMVVTADDAAATTVLADVSVNVSFGATAVGAVRWRAGRRSIVRSIAPARGIPAEMSTERQLYLIDGNGGGRWYRWEFISATPAGAHPKSSILLVDGTTEPLSFYGFNPEHGKIPMVELRKAANVRILGTKSEGKAVPVLTIDRSKNVYVALFAGNPVTSSSSATFVRVQGGQDIVLAGVVRPGPSTHALLTDLPAGGPQLQYDADEFVALFRRGTLNHAAWPVAPPPEGSGGDGGAGPRDAGLDDAGLADGLPAEAGPAEGGAARPRDGCALAGVTRPAPPPWLLVLLLVLGARGAARPAPPGRHRARRRPRPWR